MLLEGVENSLVRRKTLGLKLIVALRVVRVRVVQPNLKAEPTVRVRRSDRCAIALLCFCICLVRQK